MVRPTIFLGSRKPNISLVGKPITRKIITNDVIRLGKKKKTTTTKRRKIEPKKKEKIKKIPKKTKKPFLKFREPFIKKKYC